MSISFLAWGKKKDLSACTSSGVFQNFLFFFFSMASVFAPRTWIKSKQRVKQRVRKWAWCHSDHTHTYLRSLTGIFFSCCAVSIWTKLRCREITSGTKTEQQSWLCLRKKKRPSPICCQDKRVMAVRDISSYLATLCSSPNTSGLLYCYQRLWWQTRDKLVYW